MWHEDRIFILTSISLDHLWRFIHVAFQNYQLWTRHQSLPLSKLYAMAWAFFIADTRRVVWPSAHALRITRQQDSALCWNEIKRWNRDRVLLIYIYNHCVCVVLWIDTWGHDARAGLRFWWHSFVGRMEAWRPDECSITCSLGYGRRK